MSRARRTSWSSRGPAAGWLAAAVAALGGCSHEPAAGPGGTAPTAASQPASSGQAVPEIDVTGMDAYVVKLLGDARAAVVADPGSSNAWGRLGKACHAVELYRCAATSYESAARLAPGEFEWPHLLANVRTIDGAFDEARELLRTASRLKPDSVPTLFYLGEAEVRAGDFAAARATFERALTLSPNLGIVHLSMGRALIALGAVDEAIQHLERARDIGPPDLGVYSALASAYGRRGDKDRADAAGEKAKTLTRVLALPDDARLSVEALARSPEVRRATIQSLLRSGDTLGAIPELSMLIALEPEDALLHYHLGNAHHQTGQTDLAVGPLLRSLELEPRLHQAQALLGSIATAKGWHERAIEYYRLAAATAPDVAEYHARLASALVKAGRPGEANQEFERARLRSDLSAEGYVQWGEAQHAVGNVRGAIERYRRAVALEPKRVASIIRLGSLLAEIGESDEAARHFRRALELAPANEEARRNLAALKTSTAPR